MDEKLKWAFFDIGALSIILSISFYLASFSAFIAGMFLLIGTIVITNFSQKRERKIEKKRKSTQIK